jgi:hypothetical protein
MESQRRVTVSKSLRFEIFKRDRFTCQYCGRQPPQVILEIDHVVPSSKGGLENTNNLVTACFDCNRGKGAIPLGVQKIGELRREEIELFREKQEQVEAYEKFLLEQKEAEAKTIQELNEYWSSLCDNKYVLSEKGLLSLSKFLKGLVPLEIKEAMDIAANRVSQDNMASRFKYFCGVCYNKIREKSGDTSWRTFKEVQRYFVNKPVGSGYHKEDQLHEFCRVYPKELLIRAIDIAFGKRISPNSSYWRAFCEALEALTGDEIL